MSIDFTAQQQAYGLIKQAQRLWQQGNHLMSRITALESNADVQAALAGAGATQAQLAALAGALATITPALDTLRQDEELMAILDPSLPSDDLTLP